MAEKLCTLRTKGGGGAKYTETSLWTNSAPTSSFAAQTVSLSGNISDYKYIAIDYCYGKDYNNITSREIYTVNDFIKAVKDSGALHTIGGLTIEDNSNISYSRPVFYISDTSVAFGVCSRLNGSGTYPTASIPTEILGLNELDHGTVQTATGTFTNTAGTDITVNCGFRPKKVSIYNMADTNTICAYIYDSNMSTTYTIVAYRTSSSNTGCSRYTIGQSINGAFQSISDTGFTFRGVGVNVSTLYYVAIGESY